MSVISQSRQTHITQATIASIPSLRADGCVWVIRDTTLRGFQIRVLPTGRAVYWAEAKFGGGQGRNMKYQIGLVQEIPLVDARERAKVALDKIKSGVSPLLEKRAHAHDGITLRELIDKYFKYKGQKLKPSTQVKHRYLAEKNFKGWLDKRVVDITEDDVVDWYARGADNPAFTDRAFRFLRALMRMAVILGTVPTDPCRLVLTFAMRYEIRSRDTHIQEDDLGRFFTAFIKYNYRRDSERVARDVLVLYLTTGLRFTEAASLLWQNVDFDRKIFTIPDTKNGSALRVPMTPLTYSMFLYRKEHDEESPYVFRIKKSSEAKSPYITNCQKTLNNLCEASGIQRVTAHDLRRTFATALYALGEEITTIKKHMNHKEKDVTLNVYIQNIIPKQRKALDGVVAYYDRKIPVFEPQHIPAEEGWTSRFTNGTLMHFLYGKGDLEPMIIDDPRIEDPEWQAHAEWEYWEGRG